jgi:hypothetical protein
MHLIRTLVLLLLILPVATNAYEPIYDEAEVPRFELPDPLRFENGEQVETASDWNRRRAELLSLFASEVYGKTVIGRPDNMTCSPRKRVEGFLSGKAILEEIRIDFDGKEGGPFLDLLVVRPAGVPETGSPTIVALNFSGNHSLHPSTDITLSESWMRMSSSDRESGRIVDNRATEASRGFKASRWPLEMIVDQGVTLATFYYGDIDPDHHDEFQNGIHAVTGVPAADEWGSIGAWAWACSRVRDYLESREDIDQSRVAVFGHSRLGKTALWAGAQDERFALVISNNSGCGGAALSRRRFGERVSRINDSFPHWFCRNFRAYNEKESDLPVDQHQLVALIAPRSVYIASAEEDRWADPKGEFLSAYHASPVYELLGKKGIESKEQPGLHEPVGGSVRYHVRAGKHDVTDYDWEQYLQALKEIGPGN